MSKLANKPGGAALRKGRVSIVGQVYLVTATVHERVRVFDDFKCARVAARCFEDLALLRGSKMLAWVLMPDHVHWLIQVGENDELTRLVNRMKSASARVANRIAGRQGRLWQKAFHDHALRRDEDLQAAARYIVANPLRAGLTARLGDYPFWNAVWL